MIIAVDGPAAAGKGTLARRLAAHFGYHFLDTGTLYRMVGKALLDAGRPPSDERQAIAAALSLDPQRFADAELRGEAVGEAASIVAVMPQVRQALLDLQRQFARKPPGAVLDGRDIGTVVCPEAEVKFYVTAQPEVRARRRLMELQEQGLSADYDTVLAHIRARDARDAGRAVAPLVAAADAVRLDTSQLSAPEVLALAIGVVNRRLGQALEWRGMS